MNMSKVTSRLVATGVAAVLAVSAVTPSWSAPVLAGTTALRAVAPSATEVQWRPRYGWAIAGAAAAGIIAGAAIRPRYYGYYGGYYGPPPAVYAPPLYGVPPAYAVARGAYYPPPAYYSYRNQGDPAGCGPGTHVC